MGADGRILARILRALGPGTLQRLAVALTLGACALLSWQHLDALRSLRATADVVVELERVRTRITRVPPDLPEHAPRSPGEALDALEASCALLGASQEGCRPLTSGLDRLRRRAEALAELAPGRPEPAPAAQLRQLQAEFERETARLVSAALRELDRQAARLHRRFGLTLAGVTLLALLVAAAALVRAPRRARGARSRVPESSDASLFESLFEHAPAALAMLDRDMRYLAVSRRWLEDYRLADTDLLGRSHYAVFPELGDALKAIHRRCLAGEVIRADDDPFVRADGSLQWLQWEVRPWRTAGGEVGGIVIFSEDVTARKEAVLALRDSQALLRGLVRTIPDLVWLKDTEGRYLISNPRLEALFGVPEELLVGRTDYDFLERELADRCRANDLAAMSSAVPLVDEIELCFRGDGHREMVQTIKVPMRGPDGRLIGVLGNGRDITATKRIERELERHRAHLEELVRERTAELMAAREQAESANQAKSRFLANVTHEVRTPLNALLGFSLLLKQRPLDADSRELVDKILGSGRMLLSLINDLLDVSKIEADRLELEPQPFSLILLLERLAGLMGDSVAGRPLALGIVPPVGVDGLIGDERRLEQVLVNLLHNAIKFTERGTVELRVETQSTGSSAVQLRFAVRDTGIGISPGRQEEIFAPFSQADPSISRRFGGTGLGLAISQQLVSLMGGTLRVESQLGQGSEFWFVLRLPRVALVAAVPSAEPAGDEPREQTPGGGDGGARRLDGVRVLVVDDSPINRELVQRILEGEGAKVWLAGDGHEALEWVGANPWGADLILMDIQMPHPDGYATTRRLRAETRWPDLPVIALSASALSMFRDAAHAAGMNDFIAKPFDPARVVSMVERWAGRQHRQRPVVDRAMAVEQWGGGGVHQTYLDRFVTQQGRVGEELAELCRCGELAAAALRAHSLKGTAGALALPRVLAAVERLDARLAEDDAVGALTAARDLQVRLDEVVADVREMDPGPVAAHPAAPVGGDDDPRILLGQLLEALERHDPAAAESCLARLRGRLDAVCLTLIEAHLINFDFAPAMAVAKAWIRGLDEGAPGCR